MMEINGTFKIETVNGTIVITPLENMGEFEYERIERDGKKALDWLSAGESKYVVVDMEKIDYYGSTALSFFVRLWKRLRAVGGHMAFCNVSPDERKILHVTRLDRLWSICGSREEALATVRNAGVPPETS